MAHPIYFYLTSALFAQLRPNIQRRRTRSHGLEFARQLSGAGVAENRARRPGLHFTVGRSEVPFRPDVTESRPTDNATIRHSSF